MMNFRYTESTKLSPVTKEIEEGVLAHEKADAMPGLPVGRFTHMPDDDRLFVLACGFPARENGGRVLCSSDQGTTWEPVTAFSDGLAGAPIASDSGAFIATREGTLIAAFSNLAEKADWDWDPELKDSPDARLPVCVARSTDGGTTWTDMQELHGDWTGANRDMIQTRDGRIVFTSMKLLHNPGRHAVLTYASDDDGKTWTASNVLDLGGNGNHDGISEATLVELKDGRLLKYIRTNWGQFWRALSADGGLHWHPYGPAGIDCSSAPGFLHRLSSGRIALVWNRMYPEGSSECPTNGGNGIWSATPASVFRHEISLSFSEDECETWSPPIVILRREKGEASYPFIFEPEPGLLWITAARFGLRLQLREADLLGAAARNRV